MSQTSQHNLDHLFRGLAFYGTGGGGRAATGIAMLHEHFGKDWSPGFTSPDALPASALACATIVVGGRDPADDLAAGHRQALGLPDGDIALVDRFVRAVRTLEHHARARISALAVVELGSIAMAATLIAADRLDIPVLDCDGTGRSIPELGLAKLDLVGIPPTPLALVDRFGGETTIASAPSVAMTDHMCRFVSRAVWGRGLACAAYLQPLRRLREGLVAGSVAAAEKVGEILGSDRPIEDSLSALFTATGGRLLLRGIARAVTWRSDEPYAFRDLDYEIDGIGEHAGHRFRIWVKNEHHMVWCDEELIASSPDPIAVLDGETLEPLTTLGEVCEGRSLVSVAVPALDSTWRTVEGRALLGPRHFGFDCEAVLLA